MSLRSNGSYIGPRPTGPVGAYNGAASGIWDLRTAQRQQAAGTWPIAEFTPDLLTGLQLWLDASDASTLYDATSGGSLVAADGTVKRWEDKSGNNRHATEATNGPQRKTAIQGGRDVLRFDGSNDKLTIASSTAAFKYLHSGQSTTFIVLKHAFSIGSNGLGTLLSNQTAFTSGVGTSAIINDISGDAFDIVASNAAGVVARDQLAGIARDVFALVSVATDLQNGTQGNRYKLYKNGGAENSSTVSGSGSASTSNAAQDLRIGSLHSNEWWFLGDIAEIVSYDSALSDTDRAAVENYLLAKWAIT